MLALSRLLAAAVFILASAWLGLNVLIFDYQGYGHSGGVPSEQGAYRDAVAAWRYLTQTRRIPAAKIVVFGRSLGDAVAVWLAGHTAPAALILGSTFTSVRDMAARNYPWLPLSCCCTPVIQPWTALPPYVCPR